MKEIVPSILASCTSTDAESHQALEGNPRRFSSCGIRSKTDKPIVEQIRDSLDADKFTIFVAEGKIDTKKERILHNAYPHKAMRSLESCCNPAKNVIFVYGHSLAENDDHVFRAVAYGAATELYVSLYGDPNSSDNQLLIDRAERLSNKRREVRGDRYPLKVTFYNAESARVWG